MITSIAIATTMTRLITHSSTYLDPKTSSMNLIRIA